MKNRLFKKSIVVSIIVLFVGAGVAPCISGNDNEVRNTLDIDVTSHPRIQQNLFGNPPEEEWNKTFGGDLTDQGQYVQQTTDGGYIITGQTESYGAGEYDVWLIKTDSNGDMEWNKTFGGSNNDLGFSVQQTTDGGYIITGYTYSYGAGNEDVWLIKTDSDGDMEWNKTFGGNDGDYGSSVRQTTDGGYIIVGETSSYSAGSDDVWLIKTDSNGDMEWDKTFGGIDKEAGGTCVQQTIDGGYIITGRVVAGGYYPNLNIWLIKTNDNGNKIWDREFDGDGFDECGSCVQQTSDGGYIIAGYKEDDFWLIKTDSLGFKQWDKTFDYSHGQDYCYSVQETFEGGYILAGYAYESPLGNRIWLVKTDADGNMQWNKIMGDGSAFGYCAQQTYDGGYIIVGGTVMNLFDLWLIKLESEGIPEAPTITGETNGKKGTKYEYTFNAVDPDGDDVFYYIDWDDGNTENWIGSYPSGTDVKVNHTWEKKGTYTIKAKAKDTNGRISPDGALEVKMPRNEVSINLLFLKFLEQHPHMFPILRYIYGAIILIFRNKFIFINNILYAKV